MQNISSINPLYHIASTNAN